MAKVCPDCKTVAPNDEVPYCDACGRLFDKNSDKPRPWDDPALPVVVLIVALLAIALVSAYLHR